MRLIPLLVVLLLTSISSVRAETVATAKAIVITRDDLRTHAALMQTPYEDAWQTALHDPDPGIREDAALFVEGAIHKLLFSRTYAARAREAGVELTDRTLEAQMMVSVHGCVESHWRDSFTLNAEELSSDTLRAIAERHAPSFRQPETRTVFYLYRTSTEQSQGAFLSGLRDRVMAGEITFRDAAFHHSQAPSARQYGYLGAIQADSRLPEALKALIFETGAGEVSPPTLLHNGYYMVHVAAIREEQSPDVDDLMSPDWIAILLTVEASARASAAARELMSDGRFGADLSLAERIMASGATPPFCAAMEKMGRDIALAHQYWTSLHEAEFEPDEADLQDSYERMKSILIPSGQFQLTRYVVPVGDTPEAPVKSRDESMRVAQEIRERLAAGDNDEEAEAASAGLLEVYETAEWVMGSGVGDADTQLLRLEPGGLTSVFLRAEGAVFFRLRERRSLEPLPLEETLHLVAPNARNRRMWQLQEQHVQELVRELDLQIEWPEVTPPPP